MCLTVHGGLDLRVDLVLRRVRSHTENTVLTFQPNLHTRRKVLGNQSGHTDTKVDVETDSYIVSDLSPATIYVELHTRPEFPSQRVWQSCGEDPERHSPSKNRFLRGLVQA